MNKDILNIIYLKYFCDAVRLGSVTASSKANFVTQSAISQGISKLEKHLGIKLIAQHPNRFRITPEGEYVFQQAEKLLEKIIHFKEDLSLDKNVCIGDLAFACTYSFVSTVLTPYLKKFRFEYPETKINFELGKNQEIKQMLKAGSIDFGILPDEGDLEDYEKKEIFSGQFKLFVSKNIKPSEYHTLNLILAPSKRHETYLLKKELKEAYKNQFGCYPNIIMEIGSWEVIVNFVAEGMGIGYFPDFFGRMRKADLQECQLKINHHHYTMCAISPKGMCLRRSSEIFLSYFSNI